MSEYQYHELLALDQPMTDKQMREVRAFSTRARITPTSFVNEYHWGNFKGNINTFMTKYYDAFVYFANRGTHDLRFRLPKARRYVLPMDNDPFDDRKPAGMVTRTTIDALGLKKGQAFGYWFDLGDDWWHTISVVAIHEGPTAASIHA